jgi:predicted DNA-binding transcriptional regulator AlpA
MSEAHPALPPRLLRTEEAARWLGLSARTLEKHRCTGGGPAYRKLGGRVVYMVDDLQAWVDAGTRRSTSRPGPAGPGRFGRLPGPRVHAG